MLRSRRSTPQLRLARPLTLLVVVAAATLTPAARADDPEGSPEALAAFVEGTKLARAARWAAALAAFERADKIKPHAVTTYNIGACERAMGQYTRARQTFERAVAQHQRSGGTELPQELQAQVGGYIREIDGLLAKATITLTPGGASVAVDGRPLEAGREEKIYLAGTRDPGPGEEAPATSFAVLLDPGAHVFSFARKGFTTAVVNRTLAPGSTMKLELELDKLPATIRVASTPPGAIVTVEGADVGPAPVDVLRPAGTYRVVVKKPGRVNYETVVSVQPGESVQLAATLREDKPSIVERWWFWTAATAVVAGVAVGTYVATRPEPTQTREPVSGGSFGWKVRVP